MILAQATEAATDDPIERLLVAVEGNRAEPNFPEDSFEHEGAQFGG